MAALLVIMYFSNNINGNKHPEKNGISYSAESSKGETRIENGRIDKIQNSETSPNMASYITGNFAGGTVFPGNLDFLLKDVNTKRKQVKSNLKFRKGNLSLPFPNKALGDPLSYSKPFLSDNSRKHNGIRETSYLLQDKSNGHNVDLDSSTLLRKLTSHYHLPYLEMMINQRFPDGGTKCVIIIESLSNISHPWCNGMISVITKWKTTDHRHVTRLFVKHKQSLYKTGTMDD